MPFIVGSGGHRTWSMSRDTDGHRNYEIVFRVQVETPGRDGPNRALFFTPGLPVPGDLWIHDNEIDLWAHCKKNVDVRPVQGPGDLIKQFDLTFHFSTRGDNECQDTDIQDPLLQPVHVSGGSIHYNEEATFDRFGRPLLTSSFEQLRGPQVEFDHNRDRVTFVQNVALLQHSLCTSMRDHVNMFPIWGYPRRCVKLSDFSFERIFRGTCQVYYRRTFTFDFNYRINPVTGLIESGFDRDLPDYGNKALSGKWNRTTGEYELVNIGGAAPNPNNPKHFDRFSDRKGNICPVILNGAGLPAGVVVAGRSLFISKSDGNLNKPLSNITYWIPLIGDIPPLAWNQNLQYRTGEVTIFNGEYYLAIDNSLNNEPDEFTALWLRLEGNLSDEGNYSTSTTYIKGDYVIDSQQTGAAMLHVEKYNEADFLLLRLPLIW